jgi:hypothetical protein
LSIEHIDVAQIGDHGPRGQRMAGTALRASVPRTQRCQHTIGSYFARKARARGRFGNAWHSNFQCSR